jgi:hypothetical protein
MKRRLLVTVLAAGFILMIPLPGIFVDTFTGSFMQWISATVVEVLSLVGFPIAARRPSSQSASTRCSSLTPARE